MSFTSSPSSTGYTAAYDINGDVRWYLSFNAIWDIEKLKNGHLLVGLKDSLTLHTMLQVFMK